MCNDPGVCRVFTRNLCYAVCGKGCRHQSKTRTLAQSRRVAVREDCMAISRRNFARLAATSGAVAVASPAIAQRAIKWRLASSFPKSIEGLWGASPTLAKYVNEMSDRKFTIDPFAAGEIGPGAQGVDGVAKGKVGGGHFYGGLYNARKPKLVLYACRTFGVTPRQ